MKRKVCVRSMVLDAVIMLAGASDALGGKTADLECQNML